LGGIGVISVTIEDMALKKYGGRGTCRWMESIENTSDELRARAK